MNRSTTILAQLKNKYPTMNFHAVDYVFFVEIRAELLSKRFKNGSEDVSYTLDHERRTVKMNSINPYEMLSEVDDDFKPAHLDYTKLAEEVMEEILRITGYTRSNN
jgi:hypothetical protein